PEHLQPERSRANPRRPRSRPGHAGTDDRTQEKRTRRVREVRLRGSGCRPGYCRGPQLRPRRYIEEYDLGLSEPCKLHARIETGLFNNNRPFQWRGSLPSTPGTMSSVPAISAACETT